MKPLREAHRPGPGPVPERLLRALDLDIRRRIEGLMAGDASSPFVGSGSEIAQVRPYQPGDDVRKIEWNVTARTRVPHVRIDVAERIPTVWLALDTSASMSFGTADRRKLDVAEGVCLAVEGLSGRRGIRVGVALLEDPRPRVLPPSRARGVARSIVADVPEGTGQVDLAASLSHLHARLRHRSVIFAITDLIGEPDWYKPLTALASRHDVVVVEIRDPREDSLVDVGDVRLTDPETGRTLQVDTSSVRVLRDFEAAAARERETVRRFVRAAGADHVVLSTQGDWLRPFADFLRLRGRRR